MPLRAFVTQVNIQFPSSLAISTLSPFSTHSHLFTNACLSNGQLLPKPPAPVLSCCRSWYPACPIPSSHSSGHFYCHRGGFCELALNFAMTYNPVSGIHSLIHSSFFERMPGLLPLPDNIRGILLLNHSVSLFSAF